MVKVNRKNIGMVMFDYQLSLVNKTRDDVLRDDRWRFNFTMTKDQNEEFKAWCIKNLQKVFKFNKKKAVENFNWFRQMFGLRIKG